MTMRRTRGLILAALLIGHVGGCMESRKSLHYVGDVGMEHYKDVATQVDYPAVDEETNSVASATRAPRRIRDLQKDEIWDVTLAEALKIALGNSTIIRERDQFLSPRNPLMTNPEAASSVYDPAIQETEVRTGSRGVEAALSDFDAQFTTSMLWGRNEQVQNNLFTSGGLPAGSTLKDETGVFQQRLQKQFADSGSFALLHNWNYSGSNAPTRLFGTVYDGSVRAEYRRPLWARSGPEFTRVAGPNGGTNFGVNQGVVISRINNDISIADFEINIQNLLRDVESAYWDLSLAYRTFHAEQISRDSALQTWREIEAKLSAGLKGGGAADEAQARDNYFESQARTESALADVYSAEGQLRRLIGLSVNDGRVIRPSDEPTTAEFVPDWHMSLAEGLTRRVELRKQKWQIKSLELQLQQAKSLTRPELDFVSAYQVNAFGDHLYRNNDDDGVTPHGLGSAVGTITQGDQTGWNLGFEFRMPIGFRAAHAQVQNIELRLSRGRAALAAQELEVSHELSSAFQSLDRWYKTAQTNLNRRQAAKARVKAFQVEYDAGRGSLDLLLRAQISLAQAEIAFFNSLTEYNKAISDIHHRKGTLLEHNNVQVSEGLWDAEAYTEALRRAWARSHAVDNPFLKTAPEEFVVEGGAVVSEMMLPTDDASVPPAGESRVPSQPAIPPVPPLEDSFKPAPPKEHVVPEPPRSNPMASTQTRSVAPVARVDSTHRTQEDMERQVGWDASDTTSPAAGTMRDDNASSLDRDVEDSSLPQRDSVPRRIVRRRLPAISEEPRMKSDANQRNMNDPQSIPPLPRGPATLLDLEPINTEPAVPTGSESSPRDSRRPDQGAILLNPELIHSDPMPVEGDPAEPSVSVAPAAGGPLIRSAKEMYSTTGSATRPSGDASVTPNTNITPATKSMRHEPVPNFRARLAAQRSANKASKFDAGPREEVQPDIAIRPYSDNAGSSSERFPDLPTFRWTRSATDASDGWRSHP